MKSFFSSAPVGRNLFNHFRNHIARFRKNSIRHLSIPPILQLPLILPLYSPFPPDDKPFGTGTKNNLLSFRWASNNAGFVNIHFCMMTHLPNYQFVFLIKLKGNEPLIIFPDGSIINTARKRICFRFLRIPAVKCHWSFLYSMRLPSSSSVPIQLTAAMANVSANCQCNGCLGKK